jgi:hypothetical protein
MKGQNPQKYQEFVVNLCKLSEQQTKKHFLNYEIDINKYY